ncbi:hypothetical protein BBK14_11450 [Parafrankia soli]|uniref:Uncharacterized protein n=1 Tax=Parafrankia soli TaxID=2599596 RepID=A0A1S1R5I9_9ACTN|nr:hypothetical protein [Parafrankia soli]OHV42228.1 hypothetical protein BBK14_11450 [Parafrankia soli]
MTIWFGEPLVDAERMDPTNLEMSRARSELLGYTTLSGVKAAVQAALVRCVEAQARELAHCDGPVVRSALAQQVRLARAMVAQGAHREWELFEAASRGVAGAAL